jgi:uncharacterized protein (TIGR03437 family)
MHRNTLVSRSSLILLSLSSVVLSQVSVLTANYDNSRTNSNLSEVILNQSNVKSGTFGKIGAFPVDGQIYAQPLYVTAVQIPGLGTRDVVYTVTMHNSVYAIDAGAPASIVPLWHVNLGPSVPSSVLQFTDIIPEVGILGTPVIDIGRQVIYVVSDTLEGDVTVFRMHALSLADGHEMFNGPVVIEASVSGTGVGSNNGALPFDASLQLQRPGLALTNSTVYVGFGSHADEGDYHGWIIAYDAGDLRRRVAVFNATPNGRGGSFWHAGRAPAIDNDGNIVAVTANGDFDGKSAFGDSILKLSGRDLSVLDSFTPDNDSDLNDADEDLGSTGAILIPGAHQVLTGGKSGDLVMVDANSMGHLGPWNSPTAQSFVAAQGGGSSGSYNLALWTNSKGSTVYLLEPCGPLKAYQIRVGRLSSMVASQSNPQTCSTFSGIAVSANGDTDGTAIVWQTTADFNMRQIPGVLHAFDAADLSHELWNSNLAPDLDSLGRFAKFVAPTVVNGRVYVPTFSNRLTIYGLLPMSPVTNDEQVTVVANGASLLQGAVSPGEVVIISGANIGPDVESSLEVDGTGHASKVLADARVFFDGIAAPMLYASIGEIGAVVPFGISGPTTQLKVVYHGGAARVTVPVVPAAPALFAMNGTGGGQGAILNNDGTVNSGDNPAERGSVVSLFGTGLGQTIPVSEDGVINDGQTLPAAALPVTALIDGQPAEVLYAGAAPGMVRGFVQVNVRIPNTLTSTGDIQVALKAGDYTSPTIITLNVK